MSKKHPSLQGPRLGMSGYVRILAALPGTAEQVQQTTGLCESTVRLLLREFRQLRIIHCSATAPGRLRSAPVNVWAFGDGQAPAGVQFREVKSRPRAQSIAFGSLVRCLREPHTMTELSEETGLHLASVRRTVAALRKAGLSHVAEWQQRHGTPSRRHVMGAGKDAARPRPLTRKQINAKHNQRVHGRQRMASMLHRMAGPVQVAA